MESLSKEIGILRIGQDLGSQLSVRMQSVLDVAVVKAVTESGTSQPSAPILGQQDCIPGTHQEWEPSYRGLQLRCFLAQVKLGSRARIR